jgi:hypothetical protein
MSNREVLSSQKPFKKRAHRPWDSDLLEDDVPANGGVQSTTPKKTIPIIDDPKPIEKSTTDKGRMLIGGFFKPEGLLPDFLSTLDNEAKEHGTPPAATLLETQLQDFSEKWETVTLSAPEVSTPEAESIPSTQAVVDLSNTEALLETILKARQQEVERLSKQAFLRVKQMESQLAELENNRDRAIQERLIAEEKLSKIITQIQKHETARSEEMKKRMAAEEKISTVLKSSEKVKQKAASEIEIAQSNALMQEQARIAAEKLMAESLEQVEKYKEIVKEAEIFSEKYTQQSQALEAEKNVRLHSEKHAKGLQEQLLSAQKAQQYAEEQYCNLKLEIDTERTALQLKSEQMDKEIQSKTGTMKEIVEKERSLRVILESKLQKLFNRYKELDKSLNIERLARQQAEEKAKHALEQASKAVMHVLSVSTTHQSLT